MVLALANGSCSALRVRGEGGSTVSHIFMSHATADDAVVSELRKALDALRVPTWTDSRELTGGDQLDPEIMKAIEEAEHFLVVLGPLTQNSRWVKKEIDHALAVRRRRGDGYKVIPLLLPGVEPSALPLWFGSEPLALTLDLGPGGVQDVLPDLLAALGRRLPDDPQPRRRANATEVADLVLELRDAGIQEAEGKRRATAQAVLVYDPPDHRAPDVRSKPFLLTAPLGPIEAEELAWYLERYWRWPVGVFADRARAVEAALPQWGKLLYEAAIAPALAHDGGRNAFSAWNASPASTQRRFSVLVDESFLEEDADTASAKRAEAREAATLLLSLPWELVHDDRGYLFQGARGVRVRRCLPNRVPKDPLETTAPLRVLLVSPRPEDERARYIDHRVSARPLVEALTPLGDLAKLTILSPPTFDALQTELNRAAKAKEPYHVVHFDGHGVFDRAARDGLGGRHGLGALVFEHPGDTGKLEGRRSDIVDAGQIAGMIRDHRVPLFFLEACQSAQAEQDPTSSVAGSLLQGGVASVAAMSHSVLVETARRFISVFYREALSGARIGQAMLAAQQALKADTRRGKSFTGELCLEDWFVPVLFQEQADPQLIREVPSDQVREQIEKQHGLALGRLPDPPSHQFVGRSRDLLKAERLLCQDGKGAPRYVVLRGEGGEGKTALGCELARWLVASRRFDRVAFASLEQSGDARAVLWAIGEQLVAGFLSHAGQAPDKEEQLVERALGDHPTLLVLDNFESVLPPIDWQPDLGGFDPDLLKGILDLCERFSRAGRTRLVFTSRQPLPEPFDRRDATLGVSRLEKGEAIELVGRVLGEGNRMPRAATDGGSEEEIKELVEAVGCHARSLVLLARELMDRNLPQTTATIRQIMADLHDRYPDDRERSLFASVELSLRRLPPDLRAKLPPLGVFHGGGRLPAIGMVLGLDQAELADFARQMVDVGLAELLSYNYLRLDPALGPALLRELSGADREAAEAAWADAMLQFTRFLHQQQSDDGHLAATLTLLDLPNLLQALERRLAAAHSTARDPQPTVTFESVVGMATDLESLLARLARAKALVRVVAIREEAAARLGGWGHARCLAESAAVARLLDAGRAAEAAAAARSLLALADAAGEAAFKEAADDLARCHWYLGRALNRSGDAQSALAPLAEAEARFDELGEAGARMASICQTERADCLTALGRLDEAASGYEEAIRRAEARESNRSVATNRFQLGTVRMLQNRYEDALTAYTEALETFERLGEPRTVSTAWHQIGMVHQGAKRYDAAERAYQESLRISVQFGDRPGESSTLGQLGNLYQRMGRSEDAVRFHRQAADIYASPEVNDLANEGRARSNAADELLKLGRHDEARREIERAVECVRPFGQAVEPWKAFAILCNLERAVGNASAAAEARRQAIDAYLAYRRDGGESLIGGSALFESVAAAIEHRLEREEAEVLAAIARQPDLPGYLRPLLPALQSILGGSRDPALADDPDLDYDDAAELLLVLERLAAGT